MKDKKIYALLLLYFLANGVMLINNGIFWDDWTIIGMERLGLEQQFGENGMWIMTYVHDALNDGKYAPMLYHWLSFVFLFLAYMFFYRILKQFGFNANAAFLIAALAMVAPYFETKNTAICMSYSMFLCLFGAGAFLVFRFLGNKENRRDLFLGALLLLLSFFLNSLLLLFLFLLGLYFLNKNGFSVEQIKKNWRNDVLFYAILALLPFVFWILKKTFFPITGLYAARGYNVINFSLEKLPSQYNKIFTDNILGLYHEFKAVFADSLVFGIVIFVLSLAVSLYVLKSIKINERPKKLGFYVLLGLVLFFIATYPYILVSKLPSYTGFHTRHQILLPIGTGFFIFVLIYLLPSSFRKGFYGLVLAAFITTNLNANLNFLRGWHKQEAIKHQMKNLDINTSGVIFVKGLEGKFNATERPLTFYELNGNSKDALNRQDLFIISRQRYKKYGKGIPGILTHAVKFNMKDVPDKINEESVLEVTYLKEEITHLNSLGLTALYFFNRNYFQSKVEEILKVDYKTAK